MSEAPRVDMTPSPSVVLLDLRLGQDDGLDVLREIRARSDVPIIIMTGHRRDEVDRIVGPELGADDYVTKPFGLRRLRDTRHGYPLPPTAWLATFRAEQQQLRVSGNPAAPGRGHHRLFVCNGSRTRVALVISARA